MRTLTELRRDLKRANVDAVHALSKVSTKTLYRIRQREDYEPGLALAEKISKALDRVKLAPLPARAAAAETEA